MKQFLEEIKTIVLTFLKKATSTRFVLSLLTLEISTLLLMKGFISTQNFVDIIKIVIVTYLCGRSATDVINIIRKRDGGKDI